MQKITNLVILITSLFFSSALFAYFSLDTLCFNGGIDVGPIKQDFQTSFGEDHFAKHYPYSNLYLGLKLNQYVGLEGGYEHVYSQNENAFYPALNGETVPVLGFFSPLNTDPVFYLSETFTKGWHIDLVGYWPLCPNKTDLTASIGLSWMKMYFETAALSDPTVATPIVQFVSDNKALTRLTVGIRQKITHHFGARLQLLWENTRKLDASTLVPLPLGASNPSIAQDGYTVKPKNSYGIDIGFFFDFA